MQWNEIRVTGAEERMQPAAQLQQSRVRPTTNYDLPGTGDVRRTETRGMQDPCLSGSRASE